MTEQERATTIVESLRGRILRGLQVGTLQAGDRLPSARELVTEFHADHRLILAAYRQLSTEGLVHVRERGGIYVAAAADALGFPLGTGEVFVDMLTDAFAHEIPGPDLHEWLRRTTETLRLRAFVVATTREQVIGLARELRDDFGLNADGIVAGELAPDSAIPGAARRADVVIAPTAHSAIGERISAALGRPLLSLDVHTDLVPGEWALLLRQPVWAIVPTADVAAGLKRSFANVPGVDNLRTLVLGRDDLGTIPEGAPTYVTSAVREQLPEIRIRGRVLPAARMIATDSARSVFRFIVRANIEAMRAVTPTLKDYSSRPSRGD
ncbi:MAG TPA: GntR family transcriptional regulator [Gemmatimonadaceae bacterium]|jgi:DNA-binding transcriptional regulator YhcF (GntR family)